MNRFKLSDGRLRRINNQGVLGNPIDEDSQQGQLLMKLINDPSKKDYELVDNSRMAMDVAPEGLDALIAGIREDGKRERIEEDNELLRQEARVQMMHPEVSIDGLMDGTSRTAEQQVARNLLFRGEMPDVLPADLYSAKDLADKSQLGISGAFRPDSTIRQSTTGGLVNQTFEGETDQILEVNRNPVMTEYLSKDDEERLFNSWANSNAGQSALNQVRKRVNSLRGRQNNLTVDGEMLEQFNAAVGEYYGQQILKATGARAVSNDSNRSYKVKNNIGRNGRVVSPEDSTKGTDRLIENSKRMLDEDIDYSGDYRYVRDGEILVGDYQTGNVDDTIRLNLLKSVNLDDDSQRRNFGPNYKRVRQELENRGVNPSPDNVFKGMIEGGMLPQLVQGSDQGIGIRAGKGLSATPNMGELNFDDQFRYDEILYGHTSPKKRRMAGGYMPEQVVLVDALKANDALGQMNVTPALGYGAGVAPRVSELAQRGAAIDLTLDPRVQQLIRP